jgi:hypothetical protein
MAWAGPTFTAGKNKIINGDMGVWQRGTSISMTTSTPKYTADRFVVNSNFTSGTSTVTQQTFTPGTAPVSGYEGTYYARLTCGASPTYFDFGQKIEDVRIFAGQTVTFSFWAKATVSTALQVAFLQQFGTGGSADVSTYGTTPTLTTSWVRYTSTVTIPSISGKTVGTNSFLQPFFYSTGTPGVSQTVDVWGVQLEAGSVATPFTTATGTLQGELAACQRYYYQTNPIGNGYGRLGLARASSTTNMELPVPLPVAMRIVPTTVTISNLTTTTANTITAVAFNQATTTCGSVDVTTSSVVSGSVYVVMGNNSTSAYIAFSAEL